MRTRLTLLLALVCAAGSLVAVGAVRSTAGEASMTSQAVYQYLVKAGNECTTPDYRFGTDLVGEACIKDAIDFVVESSGPQTVMDSLVQLSGDDPRWGICHMIAHEVAHAAVIDKRPMAELTAVASPDCDGGYADGLVLATSSEEPDDKKAALIVAEICAGKDPRPSTNNDDCAHGLGHTLYLRHDTPKQAIQACEDSFAPIKNYPADKVFLMLTRCLGGIGMSTLEEDSTKNTIKLPRPLDICGMMLLEHNGSCIGQVAPWDAQDRGAKSTLTWCKTNAPQHMEYCGGAVGYWAANHGRPYTDIADFCAQFGTTPSCTSSFNRHIDSMAGIDRQ